MTSLGLMDFLMERELWKADEDSLRSTLFADYQNDFQKHEPASYNNVDMSESIDNILGSLLEGEETPSAAPSSRDELDFESLKDFEFISFEPISHLTLNSWDNARPFDNNMTDEIRSPSSGFVSPDLGGEISVDSGDTGSDVSCFSDLGSVGSANSSPVRPAGQIIPVGVSANDIVEDESEDLGMLDVSDKCRLSLDQGLNLEDTEACVPIISSSPVNSTVTIPRIRVKRISPARVISLKSIRNRPHVISRVTPKATPTTIVVTQPPTGTIIRSSNPETKSFILPINLNDLSKVKSIKIINSGTIRTGSCASPVVSTICEPSQRTFFATSNERISAPIVASSKFSFSRSSLSVSDPFSGTPASATFTIKEEDGESDGGQEIRQPNQRLVLTGSVFFGDPLGSVQSLQPDMASYPSLGIIRPSDEEKKLMRKESLSLPSYYPLTKQEERDLKRIRRKIRNKISAQDSRKRKKEYIDQLEDRVKRTSDENHQLHKRIRHLERQNETLVTQLKRFQTLAGNNLHNRFNSHTSTALMMLILSAALIVVPSLKPQDGQGDSELTNNAKMPSTGNSRSLLEADPSAIGLKNNLGIFDNSEDEDSRSSSVLSDEGFALPKKARLGYSHMDYYSPSGVRKTFTHEDGEPPDGIGGSSKIEALMGAMFKTLAGNWTHPWNSFSNSIQKNASREIMGRDRDIESSVVVNLNKDRRFRDDIELE